MNFQSKELPPSPKKIRRGQKELTVMWRDTMFHKTLWAHFTHVHVITCLLERQTFYTCTFNYLSSGETHFVPIGLSIKPPNFCCNFSVFTKPNLLNFLPEHFFGSHCSKSHIAKGQGNFSVSTSAGSAKLYVKCKCTFQIVSLPLFTKWNFM